VQRDKGEENIARGETRMELGRQAVCVCVKTAGLYRAGSNEVSAIFGAISAPQ